MAVNKANGGEDNPIARMSDANLSGVKRIVSSSHLVSEKVAELSEVEYGLIVGWNAFGKWKPLNFGVGGDRAVERVVVDDVRVEHFGPVHRLPLRAALDDALDAHLVLPLASGVDGAEERGEEGLDVGDLAQQRRVARIFAHGLVFGADRHEGGQERPNQRRAREFGPERCSSALARRHNLRAFAYTILVSATENDDENLKRLRPGALHILSTIP